MSGQEESLQLAQKAIKGRRKFVVILLILLFIALLTSAFLFVKYKRELNSNPVNRQRELTQQLGQLIEMPNEEPVISTVLDKSKLTNKTLAKRAQNGDQLFIFTDSKRLILYRPSDHKVVDMLNIQN